MTHSIITIPRYIWKTLYNKGITVTYLDNLIADIYETLHSTVVFDNNTKNGSESFFRNITKPLEGFVKIVSDHDMKDLIYSDLFIFKKLTENLVHTNLLAEAIREYNPRKFSYGTGRNLYDQYNTISNDNDFINFTNTLIDSDMEKINKFIMSINTPDSQNELFEIITGEYGIFIILNNGFNNYNTLSNNYQKLFKLQFLNTLYNKIYSTYGPNVANKEYRLLENLLKLHAVTDKLRIVNKV